MKWWIYLANEKIPSVKRLKHFHVAQGKGGLYTKCRNFFPFIVMVAPFSLTLYNSNLFCHCFSLVCFCSKNYCIIRPWALPITYTNKNTVLGSSLNKKCDIRRCCVYESDVYHINFCPGFKFTTAVFTSSKLLQTFKTFHHIKITSKHLI